MRKQTTSLFTYNPNDLFHEIKLRRGQISMYQNQERIFHTFIGID